MRFNPYIAGNPIGDDGFFGREDVLRKVLRVLHNPKENAIVLYGQRRIGKTSVLLQLERQLRGTGNFDAVYFDLQDKAGLPLKNVLYELAQRIALNLNLSVPQPGQFDQQAGNYFQNSFLPQAIEHNGKDLVLLFDEFDVLDSPSEGQAGQKFFPYLRDLMRSHQKLQFVFVIGRRPDELSNKTISVFKGVPSTNVALLTEEDTTAILRQSEYEGTLSWSNEAITKAWEWTQGHPYFTQLLGSVVWEQVFEDEPEKTPTATAAMVLAAIPTAFERGRNAFVWIWDGLPPAERVVMAAMAVAEETVIHPEKLVQILNESGVRLIVRQLKLAPETLVEWGILKPVNGGHRFTVPLLHRWIQSNRPLHRTKEELDRVEPHAERLFQTGQDFYNQRDLENSASQTRLALQTNPNHLKARLLLGQILLERKELDEAVQILEDAYAYDPGAARSDLIRALLAQAKEAEFENLQLNLYNRVLKLDSSQPEAKIRKEELIAQQRKNLLSSGLSKANKLESIEDWHQALIIYNQLQAEFPNYKHLQELQQNAEIQEGLLKKYNEALEALKAKNKQTAQKLLAQVIYVQPDYKEAVQYLMLAVNNINVTTLLDDYQNEQKQHRDAAQLNQELNARVHELENQLSTFQEQQIYNEKIRHQEKADQPEGQPESVSQLSKMSRLKTWHPIDQGRLLWWLFLAPQQLKAYRQQYGIKAEQSVGKWLSSTLTWLPLFLLVMGLRLQTLPSVGLDNNSFYWLGSGIVFSWLITGNWGDSERIIITGAALVFAVVVAVIIGFSVAESVLTSVAAGIMIGIMAVVMAGIANFVTGVVAGGGASGVPIGVAGGLVTGVAVGVVSHVSSVNVSIVGVVIVTFVAAIVAFILWFAVVAIGNYVMLRFWPVEDETINALSYIVAVAGFAVTGGVVADVMGLSVVTFVMIGGAVGVTVITVIGMQIILAGIIKDGQPSWLLKGGGGALVGAYLFLVWFSFLSGYRAF